VVGDPSLVVAKVTGMVLMVTMMVMMGMVMVRLVVHHGVEAEKSYTNYSKGHT
jgi:hypothetical protein